jgi:hypothetical protein
MHDFAPRDDLFITARHVIGEVLRDGRQISPLVILHLRSETGLFGPSDLLYRSIRFKDIAGRRLFCQVKRRKPMVLPGGS